MRSFKSQLSNRLPGDCLEAADSAITAVPRSGRIGLPGLTVAVHGEPRKYTPCASAAAERPGDELGDLGGVRRGPDASLPQRLALGFSRALTTRDDGAGMPHSLALGGREASDVGHDGDTHLAPYVLGRELLGVTADLPDHHGALRLGVGLELAQDLDKVRPYDRVAADPHGAALSDLPLGELVDDLVRQGAAPAYDADIARHKDVAGHYGDVSLLGRENARTVRPDERRALVLEVARYPHHVVDGDALGDAADGRETRVQRLEDGVGGEGWGDEDHARVRARPADGPLDRIEDGDAFVVLPALTGGHPRDDIGAALKHPSRVECAFPAGYPLNQEPRTLVYQYRHLLPPPVSGELYGPAGGFE